eukprot:TRINITY_DN11222_c0_g1_i2.p1 TRINITY_DN11222_c0_g1~~TRINITY_DN11222_c0_g1_i2.p1  ORF type:complete len:460 (+),score=136.86 TRINITY_DN11222_c0_g1_i2:174-1553(+)
MMKYKVMATFLLVLFCVWQLGLAGRRPGLQKYSRGHVPVVGSHQFGTQDTGKAEVPSVSSGETLAKPHKNKDGLPTIFVSVAAFRDQETNITLHSLFARAAHPERVFVGLICQMSFLVPNEQCLYPGSWDTQCGNDAWCPTDNIISRTFDAKHSKGPTYARYLASLLYRGEDYFMMIDSHNRFVRNWDEVILSQHAKTGKIKSVLSTYPMAINLKDESKEEVGVAYLCSLGTHGGGWTAGFPGPYWANTYHPSDYPKPQPYIGAGLVFGPGSMVEDVPFDPHLPYLFFGEEFMIGIRLWTNGYDLFSPSVNILYHHYNRHGPRMESHGSKVGQIQAIAHKRIQHILGITKKGSNGKERNVPLDTTEAALIADLPKYGLGKVRSLWQYWKYARLDPIVMSRQTFKDPWCTNYGPRKGPYDDAWKKYAQDNDIEPSLWWQNGVAKLSVPPNYTSADSTVPH